MALVLGACERDPEPAAPARTAAPPHARWETVELLRRDLEAPRHASDGAGRAWLDGEVSPRIRSLTRFPIVFEAGPQGVARGGAIFLQVSPFWGWSPPQLSHPEAPGFTTVHTDAGGVELVPRRIDPLLLAVEVQGRALAAGEQVRFVYGAGPGARTDRFAEREERVWIAVDGDGDGVRRVVADSPRIEVRAGPAAALWLTAPSVVRPGETYRVTVAALDAAGNAAPWSGEVTLSGDAPGLPRSVRLTPEDAGAVSLELEAGGEGVHRIEADAPDGLSGRSPPVLVSASFPKLYWGDLHGHSNFSDGTGTPEDYYRYARDVAGLDVAALTDHDHWGIRFLDQHPELFEEIRRQTRRHHEPGRFVTLLGYEWTSWIHGHRHVLFFSDQGELLSSLDPAYETPSGLWNGLRGRPALTLTHHSAGGPIATDWSIPPDPVLEPLAEIVSVHGSSEAPDTPLRIYAPVDGNSVRDALGRGYRLGFVGSGDGHDGHPGLAHLAGPSGGLAAILAETLTRESVLEALRARRTYATSGPRILLHVMLGDARMGEALPVAGPAGAAATLRVQVVGVSGLERIDVVRSGRVVAGRPAHGSLQISWEHPLEALRAGEYVYARVVQQDGHAAWSSPVFLEDAPR